jgi:transposase
MSKKTQRNWSQYNHRLKSHSRIEVFVSPACRNAWLYKGHRHPGGKRLYSEDAIEACLLIREYFGLGLRQTEGFVQSILDLAGAALAAPDYTTLSRRCGSLQPKLARPARGEGVVIAVDSTGLSLYSANSWHRARHRRGRHCNMQWRKLHIAIDAHTGMIVAADYSDATHNDCQHLPALLDQIPSPIAAVAADMAYDKGRCRQAIHARRARQLIPPQKNARLSRYSHRLKPLAECLQERDDAIRFLHHNAINGDLSPARKKWKEKVGYHVRSRVETTFWQMKTHTGDRLANRSETNRKVQAILKCVLINKLAAC